MDCLVVLFGLFSTDNFSVSRHFLLRMLTLYWILKIHSNRSCVLCSNRPHAWNFNISRSKTLECFWNYDTNIWAIQTLMLKLKIVSLEWRNFKRAKIQFHWFVNSTIKNGMNRMQWKRLELRIDKVCEASRHSVLLSRSCSRSICAAF